MSLYDDMPDVIDKKRKIEAISQGNNTTTTTITTTTTTATSTNITNDKKNDINIPETITKLSNYMNKDDKFVKASSLFVNVINSYINDDNNTIELILRSITLLITLKRDYDNTIYRLSYVNIFRSLYDNIDLCKAFIISKSPSSSSSSSSTEGEGVITSLQVLSMNELTNWISKTVLVHDLDTDDSYTYTQCCKDITMYIKSLDNTTTTNTNTTDDIEKQVIILKLLSTSYKSYHLAWKCPLIKAMFKEASTRRLKFDASLRNELDDLNTNMMKDERKTSSNTKNRTVRVTNSIAHPLRNVGGEHSILR